MAGKWGYQFEGNIGDCFRQIGNAVPPLLAAGLGEHIMGILSGVSGSAGSFAPQKVLEEASKPVPESITEDVERLSFHTKGHT